MRVSLGGGGTDLPSYYEQFGGSLLAAAINRYVYISINKTFTDDYFLKYSELERVREIDEIRHSIIRESLRAHPVGRGVEIVSMADISSGTGLGSSGSFTVGLLRALHAYNREHVTAGALGEEACRIEIDVLGRPVGKQDQYIAAFGGLTWFDFDKDGSVHVSPLMLANETLHDLEEHLLMFFTGYSRDADLVLTEQKSRSTAGDRDMLDSLHFVRELGVASKHALERGDTAHFGGLMHEHWEHKKLRSKAMSNERIDHWYEVGRTNGALGGKLVGAGAGGFLMFFAEDQDRVRRAMAEEGLREVRFAFDHEGATLLARG